MKKQLLLGILIIGFGWCNIAKANWQITNSGVIASGNPAYINTNALAVMGSIIFAGTDSGVYVTVNNGASWEPRNKGITPVSVSGLAVMGTNIFASVKALSGGGIFLSADSGKNWTSVSTGLAFGYMTAVAVDGSNVFAQDYSGQGTFMSSNKGATWKKINTLTGDFTSLIRIGGNLFAGTSVGLFMSTDNGTTWSKTTNTGLTYGIKQVVSMGTTLFAAVKDGIYKSTDNGASWAKHSSGSDVDNSISLAVYGTNLFVGTPKGVFFSTDNGGTYTNAGLGISSTVTLAISGTDIYAGTVFNINGIFKRALSEMVTVSSVNTNINNISCKMFPNPTCGKFKIEGLQMNSNYQVEVYNISGQKVLQQQNHNEFDLSDATKGVYFVRVFGNTNNYAGKIVIE